MKNPQSPKNESGRARPDQVEPPHHFVHVPQEIGHDAPDVPGYLPQGRMVDHLSSIEHWLIGTVVFATIAIQFWKMTQ